MLALAAPILAGGPKGFFENPAYLIGVPLLALGVLGALIVFSPIELRWPQPQERGAPQTDALAEVRLHPDVRDYVIVGIVLFVGTLIEVAAYYIDMPDALQLGVMLSLMALDFVLVALWFMHLRFDSGFFSTLFAGGLLLVLALFVIVLATLGASLV